MPTSAKAHRQSHFCWRSVGLPGPACLVPIDPWALLLKCKFRNSRHGSSPACLMQLAFASQELRSGPVVAEGAAVGSSANVLRPMASPFISLRHPLRRPRQRRRWFARTKQPPWIRLVGHSAQRHKGGDRRSGDSRGAECPGSLIHPVRRAGFGMSSFRERSIGTQPQKYRNTSAPAPGKWWPPVPPPRTWRRRRRRPRFSRAPRWWCRSGTNG